MSPSPAAELMEEVIEEILLRFPPHEPACLVRAALVCKRWCRLVSGPGFSRRFREFHRTPPMPPLPLGEPPATPPPPSSSPPPILYTRTVRNEQEAEAALEAWNIRGFDGLAVHIPEDIDSMHLEQIWLVLRTASLSIFRDPERIAERLSAARREREYP